MSDVAARIRAALDRLAGDGPALGLAVSGGGDSVALMRVAAAWAGGRRLMVATVDHGLRPDSGAEAQRAGRMARDLGLPHTILRWQRDTHAGNLMAQARDARLRLLSGWARRNGLPAVALGHTADDLAETLLMRLARGSGIDGLAAMADWRDAFDMRWLRPMLGVGRQETRDWLRREGAAWIDDPTNENTDYERIRTRRAIATLGLDVSGLARSAGHIAEARAALSSYAALVAKGAAADRGSLVLPRTALRDAPEEIRRRLVVAACRWVTGAEYPPRRATLLHALDALRGQGRVTLDGCLIAPSQGDRLRFMREPAAAARAMPSTAGSWDRRWRIEGLPPGHHVAALGVAGIAALAPDWRRAGLSRDEAAALPALWLADQPVAAPVLTPHPTARLTPLRAAADFHSLVKAH